MLFGVKVGKKGYEKTPQKTDLQKSHASDKNHFGKPPCGPLKEQSQGSQDWQPNQGIRDTPLVLAGMVADF